MASLTCTALLEIQKMAFEKERRELLEAAKFEARVAAKLANPQWAVCWNSDSCLEFGGSKDEPRWVWNCEWCRLKHARLQVEEEMDAEV